MRPALPARFHHLDLTLTFVLILFTAVHLLAVNVATSGPLLAQWLRWRELRRGDKPAGLAGKYLAAQSLVAVVWGVLLGLIGLALLWWIYPRSWFDVFLRVPPRRLWFGAAEILFYMACVYAYMYGWTRWKDRPVLRWVHAAIPFVAATNLVYHFAGLFAIVATLSEEPQQAAEPFRFLPLLGQPETLARVLHNVLSSFAVGGVTLMFLARRTQRFGASQEDVARLIAWGARVALAPTLLQVLAGLFLLLHLPAESRNLLLGGDWVTTGLLGMSLAAALIFAYQLAVTAQGETSHRDVSRSLGWLLMTVLLMVAMRQQARATIYSGVEQAARADTAGQASRGTLGESNPTEAESEKTTP